MDLSWLQCAFSDAVASYTGSVSPAYAERQESLTLKFSFPSHWLPKLSVGGQWLPDPKGAKKKKFKVKD